MTLPGDGLAGRLLFFCFVFDFVGDLRGLIHEFRRLHGSSGSYSGAVQLVVAGRRISRTPLDRVGRLRADLRLETDDELTGQLSAGISQFDVLVGESLKFVIRHRTGFPQSEPD